MSRDLKLTVYAQWFANGDFPNESPEREGTVVRYFRHPNYEGSDVCPHCNEKYHNHGFIDAKKSIVVCPGDVLFSFEDPNSANFIDSIGKISQKTYAEIFGANSLFKAQRNCGSFARGETTSDMLGFWMKNSFIPMITSRMKRRAEICGCRNITFSDMPEREDDQKILPFYVEVANNYVREYWNILRNKNVPLTNPAYKIFAMTDYREMQNELRPHGLELISREHLEKAYGK